MKLTEITAETLKDFFLGGCSFLTTNKQSIDALNVFPVPDGDTGTNMALTVNSAVKDLARHQTVSEVVGAISMGALMGARGNSGVILSQLFRGFAQGASDKRKLSALDFALALKKGVDLAYKSVMKPVEGTILTVSKAVALAAVNAAKKNKDIIEVLEYALGQGNIALQNTPNQLPILKQAGVVDAGGKGFLVILEGGIMALRGEAVPVQLMQAETPTVASDISTAEITFQYCTELILKGDNLSSSVIQDFLADKGDSLLVVGTENLIKIHIHTNHPGQVLEYAMSLGSLHDIKIDNMKDQHQETQTGPEEVEPEDDSVCEVVAVAAGDGLVRIFKSMGVKHVINGGQTMNPSAEELVSAINKLSAEQVIILPNNSNIILTAEQAKHLTGKVVEVIPTKTLAQGISAMLAYDTQQTAQVNAEKMVKAYQQVRTGEITYAVRDSSYDGMTIKANDILGLWDGTIKEIGQRVEEVVLKLLTTMVEDDSEIISLFYGSGVSEEEAQNLAAQVGKVLPNKEIEVYYGGQPLYFYLISVE